MTFFVGQKVVYIGGKSALNCNRPTANLVGWPSEMTVGRVLTVRDIDVRYVPQYGVAGLRFEELVYREVYVVAQGWVEPAFPADLFRPVAERKTDISIFRKLLEPSELEKARRELV